MSDIALRPRSPTELVDAAFQLYRRDPLPLITGAAVILVPWNLFLTTSGTFARFSGMGSNETGAFGMTDIAPLMYYSVGFWLVYLLVSNITMLLANESYFGRTPDLKKAFIGALAGMPAVFITSIFTLFVASIGLLFLILPGLYLLARLFATRPAILLEHAGVGRAIGRSWSLSKGQVRHVVNTVGLVVLLGYAIMLGSSLLALLIPSVVVRPLINMIAACLVYPMYGIVATLLYYDVRIRREGFDIEYLAMATPAPTGVPVAP